MTVDQAKKQVAELAKEWGCSPLQACYEVIAILTTAHEMGFRILPRRRPKVE